MKKSILFSFILPFLVGCSSNLYPSRSITSNTSPISPLPEDKYSKLPSNIKDYEGIKSISCKQLSPSGKSLTKDFIIDLDYTKIIDNDLTVFDKNFAALASAYAVDLYFQDNYLATKNPKTGQYDYDKSPNSFAKYVGGKDPRYFDLSKCENYETDPFDFTTLSFTHIDFDYNNQTQQIFFINIKGTFYLSEWISNLDMGSSKSTLYSEDLLKEHPDWKNYDNHKGFDVTFNRSIGYINKYIETFKNSSANQTYFVIGHSRGAAIANLVAKYLIDNNNRTVCYALASPRVSEIPVNGNYNSIFNCYADDDFVAYVPPRQFGFYNYGQEMQYSLKNDFAEAKYFEYFNTKLLTFDVGPLAYFLSDLLISRDQTYNYFDTIDDTFEKESFNTQSEAMDEYSILKRILSDDLLAKRFIKINEPYLEEDEWVVTFNIAPAAFIYSIGDILLKWEIGPGEAIQTFVNLSKFLGRFFAVIIKDIDAFLNLNVNAIKQAHIAETYLFYYAVLA